VKGKEKKINARPLSFQWGSFKGHRLKTCHIAYAWLSKMEAITHLDFYGIRLQTMRADAFYFSPMVD
jgi:hypothetical protein